MYLMDDDAVRLRTIISAVFSGDNAWLESQGIDAKDKGTCWIVNYSSFAASNEYNRLVRGLVIDKKPLPKEPLDLIVSFPFVRFFNREQPEAENPDLSNSEMLEKMDGTMVGVYFPEQTTSPSWHTRKMVSCHQPDRDLKITTFHGGEYQFIPLIGEYVKKIPFSTKDLKYTYVFEFIHEASFVWTKYTPEQHGLYLLGARDMQDFHELTETELDDVARRLEIRRPRRWDAVNEDQKIMSLMKEICQGTAGFEGFVFRDKNTGKRVKLKDADYVKFHHMIDKLSYRNLVLAVLEGETGEIMAYFPSAKPRIEKILAKMDELVNITAEKIIQWHSKKLSRKDMALRLFGGEGQQGEEENAWVRRAIITHSSSLGKDQICQFLTADLRKIAMGTTDKNAGSPRKFLELIGINDDVDSSIAE